MTDYTELVKELRYGAEYGCDADLIERAADAIEELVADLGDADAMTGMWMRKYEALQAQLPKRGQYVHGRELSREYIGDCLVSIDYEDWRCSVCGIVFEQWSIPKYNYCPNCGAKMNGEQNVE